MSELGSMKTDSAAPLTNSAHSQRSESAPEPSGWSFRVPCAPFGIPIHIHYTLPLYLAIILVSYMYSPRALVFLGIVNGPILFGTILIHEWGHCLMSRLVGGTADHILLWPLGGLAFIGHSAGRCADVAVALAGPVTHIPMAFFWWMLAGAGGLRSFNSGNLWTLICTEAVVLNVALFVFNLLVPAYPLDGGRVLANLLLICGVECNTAAKICCVLTFLVSGGLIAWGVYSWLEEYGGSVMFVVVPLWLCFHSWQLWKMAVAGQADQHPLFGQEDSREREYRALEA